METITTIALPAPRDRLLSLRAGDIVHLNGALLMARDAAHKRIAETIGRGEKLPFDVENMLIYFAGPAPAKPGQIANSAGPTTANRMEKYFELMLSLGAAGFIGKGALSDTAVALLREHNACYLSATGGAGALYAKTIAEMKTVAYDDLGPEAVRLVIVKNFPVITAADADGNNQFELGRRRYRK